MPELRKLVKEHGYDPASLPSGSVGFSKKINALFTDITVHGNAGYDNGRFHGLATLHRFSLLMSLYIGNGRVAKSDITTHHREIYRTQLLLLGKFEYTGGPIFKVVLEC